MALELIAACQIILLCCNEVPANLMRLAEQSPRLALALLVEESFDSRVPDVLRAIDRGEEVDLRQELKREEDCAKNVGRVYGLIAEDNGQIIKIGCSTVNHTNRSSSQQKSLNASSVSVARLPTWTKEPEFRKSSHFEPYFLVEGLESLASLLFDGLGEASSMWGFVRAIFGSGGANGGANSKFGAISRLVNVALPDGEDADAVIAKLWL